jgi:hypothetical protein
MIRFLFLLALLALPLRPAVVPRMSLEDLASTAELIVHGRIGASWTDWDTRHMFLWTHYRVESVEMWKGSAAEVVVSEPGGELNGERMEVPGAVAYSEGEEVVLFLQRMPAGYWRALGYQQGKFSVVERAGRKLVHPNTRGMLLVEPSGKPSPVRATSIDRVDGQELNAFRTLVRTMELALPAN